MKHHSLLWISLLFSVLFYSSCCNKSEESARYPLTEEDKSFVPYLKDQSITFQHSGGQQFIMSVFNADTAWSKTFVEHCNENYVSYEYKIAELYSTQPQFYLSLMVTPKEFDPGLLITVNNTNFRLETTSPPTVDSITIGENIFHDVYVITNKISDTTIIQPDTLLFNKAFGVLQIKMTNHENFSIVP